MAGKSGEKKWARALQEDTGWSYSECLHLVRTKTDDEIDLLIEERKAAAAAKAASGKKGEGA